MANSAENPGLSGPSKIANRSMSTESEDQRKHSQTPPRENARKKRKRKRKRSDITGPERTGAGGGRAGDGWAEENKAEDNNGNFSSPSSSAPVQRIPLRTLLEAEARLVYGGEQDITHKSSQAPACAGSQLMCQPAEILGPRSGPNLSSLPQIDKWLDVALQDADSCYRQKRYDTAASRFTTALKVLYIQIKMHLRTTLLFLFILLYIIYLLSEQIDYIVIYYFNFSSSSCRSAKSGLFAQILSMKGVVHPRIQTVSLSSHLHASSVSSTQECLLR